MTEPKHRSMAQVYARVATLIALPLALVALVPSVIGIGLLQAEVKERCKEGRVNRDAIRSTIIDGLPALGYRFDEETGEVVRWGAPIDYYATHPHERQEALSRSSAALERFPPVNCP